MRVGRSIDAAIVTHAAVTTAHHTQYTDGEVDAIVLVHKNKPTDHQDAPTLIGNHAGDSAAHHVSPGAIELSVAHFQVIPCTGDVSSPQYINDNNTGTQCSASAIGKYGEIDLGELRICNQYRYHGAAGQNADGHWKIEYWDVVAHAWVEWVTDVSTRTASWSEWDDSGGAIITNKIRITLTAVDTQGLNVITQLEVKYA